MFKPIKHNYYKNKYCRLLLIRVGNIKLSLTICLTDEKYENNQFYMFAICKNRGGGFCTAVKIPTLVHQFNSISHNYCKKCKSTTPKLCTWNRPLDKVFFCIRKQFANMIHNFFLVLSLWESLPGFLEVWFLPEPRGS